MKKKLLAISCGLISFNLLAGCAFVDGFKEGYASATSGNSDGSSSSSGDSLDYWSASVYERILDNATEDWQVDPSVDLTGSQSTGVYLSDYCAVWEFADVDRVNYLVNSGFFDSFEWRYWYGEDSYSSSGIVLLTDDPSQACAYTVQSAVGWDSLEQ